MSVSNAGNDRSWQERSFRAAPGTTDTEPIADVAAVSVIWNANIEPQTMPARLGQVLYWTACGMFAVLVTMASPSGAMEATNPPLELTLNADGSVTLAGELIVGQDALESKFREFAQQKPPREIQIRPDGIVKAEVLAVIFAAAQKAGLKIGLVTRPLR